MSINVDDLTNQVYGDWIQQRISYLNDNLNTPDFFKLNDQGLVPRSRDINEYTAAYSNLQSSDPTVLLNEQSTTHYIQTLIGVCTALPYLQQGIPDLSSEVDHAVYIETLADFFRAAQRNLKPIVLNQITYQDTNQFNDDGRVQTLLLNKNSVVRTPSGDAPYVEGINSKDDNQVKAESLLTRYIAATSN